MTSASSVGVVEGPLNSSLSHKPFIEPSGSGTWKAKKRASNEVRGLVVEAFPDPDPKTPSQTHMEGPRPSNPYGFEGPGGRPHQDSVIQEKD